jgi:5-methylcytosine-specific restriction endonuclease McrA
MGLKDDILELRGRGLPYRQIEARLGCSKGTISYHCGEGQKEKTRRNTRRRRLCPLRTKMEAFLHGRRKETRDPHAKSIGPKRIFLRDKIIHFSTVGTKANRKGYKFMFKLQDLISKIGDDPRCHWTGRAINLNDRRSYHLDHLMPKSRGGDNSLKNCVLACREANQGKGDCTPREYVQLCCEVAVRRGKKTLARTLARDPEFREMLARGKP